LLKIIGLSLNHVEIAGKIIYSPAVTFYFKYKELVTFIFQKEYWFSVLIE